jgi:hypothetical protein
MSTLNTASMVALLVAAASASPSGSQIQLEATGHGIIDSVRDVLSEAHPAGYADAVEHALGPREQIVVRLDGGQALTIVQDKGKHFEPEERVLLSPSKIGIRLEHAPR